MKKECHPLCLIFRPMDAAEYEALKKSIRESGLLESITLHRDGRILDGRCRQDACYDVGVSPRYQTFKGNDEEAALYVIGMNIARRHLTSSQRACCAVEALGWFEAEAAKRAEAGRKRGVEVAKAGGKAGRPKKGEIHPGKISGKDFSDHSGEATVAAAKAFKTTETYVKAAKKLKAEAPDLLDAVKRAEITIPAAKKILDERKEVTKRELDPTEEDWPAKIRKFKRKANDLRKYVEAQVHEIQGELTLFKKHLDEKEVNDIHVDVLASLSDSFRLCAARIEPGAC